MYATAMAARAKERKKTSATSDASGKKDTPPSATNPSAAMNVGKEEGQLMGMEGRAARLGAKSATAKKRQQQQQVEDSSSSGSDSSLDAVADKIATTSMGTPKKPAGSSAKPVGAAPPTDERKAKTEAPSAKTKAPSAKTETPAAKQETARGAGPAGAKQQAVPAGKSLADAMGDKYKHEYKSATAKPQVAEANPEQVAPSEVGANDDTAEAAPGKQAEEQLLHMLEAFLDDRHLEMMALRKNADGSGADGAGGSETKGPPVLDKAAHSKLLQTLCKSMGEMDAAMEVLQQLRTAGHASSVPVPRASGDGERPQLSLQDGVYMLSRDDKLHPQYGAEEIVLTQGGDLDLARAVRLVADGGTVRVVGSSSAPAVPASGAGLVGMGSLEPLPSRSDGEKGGEETRSRAADGSGGGAGGQRRLEWLSFGTEWPKAVHVRGLVRAPGAAKHPSTDIESRWLLAHGSEGSVRDCRLRHDCSANPLWCPSCVPTVDVWGGPWLFEQSAIKSVGGSAVVVMGEGQVNITECKLGGNGTAAASDCLVAGAGEVFVSKTDLSFAVPAAGAAAAAQFGAGGGISVWGSAKCKAEWCHIHDCARGVFVDDAGALELESVGFSCLSAGALAAGPSAGQARLSAVSCVLHQLSAKPTAEPAVPTEGGVAGGGRASDFAEAAPWVDERRPGICSGQDNQFSVAA
jgi:hypothetical protein